MMVRFLPMRPRLFLEPIRACRTFNPTHVGCIGPRLFSTTMCKFRIDSKLNRATDPILHVNQKAKIVRMFLFNDIVDNPDVVSVTIQTHGFICGNSTSGSATEPYDNLERAVYQSTSPRGKSGQYVSHRHGRLIIIPTPATDQIRPHRPNRPNGTIPSARCRRSSPGTMTGVPVRPTRTLAPQARR